MGTTGTIMGVSRFLKEKNPAITIIGAQPEEGAHIPGIRKWPEAYLPKIYDAQRVDRIESVTQADAEDMARRLAREEGIFGGISAGGACAVALRISREVANATIVFVVCDRGDRYLSTGVFPAMTPILVFDIETVPDVAGIRRINDVPANLPDAAVVEWFSQKRRARHRHRFRAALPAAGRRDRLRAAQRRRSQDLVGRRRRTMPSPSSSAASSTASTSSRRSSCRGTAAASTCRCSIIAR